MKIRILYLQLVVLCISSYVACAFASGIQSSDYFLKPTGIYGVSYQDIFLINTDICPDAFYQENINDSDFSPNNTKHCHEIALRVYYPSQNELVLNDERYAPPIIETNKWLAKKYNLSKQDMAKLDTILKIKTYTTANSEPINQKFPIIIFMPGSGSSVQTYTNIVSDLVSNGYIVIGINSLFINGALELSNGHIVSPPDAYSDVHGREENIGDLKFVLDHITDIKYEFNLKQDMDFNCVGLIGHSRGAMSIVNLLKQNQNYKEVRAVILMDPGDGLMQANYPLSKFSIPKMTMWSSLFKNEAHGSSLVGEYNYEIILKPKNANDNFSDHNNFSDNSTLQYHPAYQIKKIHKLLAVGNGDGYTIAKEINDYVLNFFNRYLKNEASNELR